MDERLQKASTGDWQTLRSLKPDPMAGWETSFAESSATIPTLQLIATLRLSLSHLPPIPPKDAPAERPEDFTMLELVQQGKGRKSVAGDQVSHELLQTILDQGEGPKLLAWFNKLLHGAPLPTNWADSVMVLLLKISCPTLAKHLRPINMNSEVCKTFSRPLLARTKPMLQQANSWKCASQGRQPSDLIYTIIRGMMQEKEWKRAIVYLKIEASGEAGIHNRLDGNYATLAESHC